MNKATKTKLEKKFANRNLEILSVQPLSGNAYKASLEIRYYMDHNDRVYNSNIVVKRKETYEQALDTAVNW